MSVQSTVRTQTYNGNDTATVFTFSFKVFAKTDLDVVLTVAGVDSALVLDSDFSVSLNADQEISPGGTVTYPISGAPLATGETLTVISDVPVTQPTRLSNVGPYLPEVVEAAFDRAIICIQQIVVKLGRALLANLSGDYDAHGHRIINVGDPVNAQDATTKSWAITQFGGLTNTFRMRGDFDVTAGAGLPPAVENEGWRLVNVPGVGAPTVDGVAVVEGQTVYYKGGDWHAFGSAGGGGGGGSGAVLATLDPQAVYGATLSGDNLVASVGAAGIGIAPSRPIAQISLQTEYTLNSDINVVLFIGLLHRDVPVTTLLSLKPFAFAAVWQSGTWSLVKNDGNNQTIGTLTDWVAPASGQKYSIGVDFGTLAITLLQDGVAATLSFSTLPERIPVRPLVAFSSSGASSVTANFGATPFAYPITGCSPTQTLYPDADASAVNYLVTTSGMCCPGQNAYELCNATGGNITRTLPSAGAGARDGQIIRVEKTDSSAHVVTFLGTTSESVSLLWKGASVVWTYSAALTKWVASSVPHILAADSTVTVGTDYATIADAVAYAKNILLTNGAVLTIFVPNTYTGAEQLLIENCDLTDVVLAGELGTTISTVGWVPGLAPGFSTYAFINGNNAVLPRLLGNWALSTDTPAAQFINAYYCKTLGGKPAAGFQLDVMPGADYNIWLVGGSADFNNVSISNGSGGQTAAIHSVRTDLCLVSARNFGCDSGAEFHQSDVRIAGHLLQAAGVAGPLEIYGGSYDSTAGDYHAPAGTCILQVGGRLTSSGETVSFAPGATGDFLHCTNGTAQFDNPTVNNSTTGARFVVAGGALVQGSNLTALTGATGADSQAALIPTADGLILA